MICNCHSSSLYSCPRRIFLVATGSRGTELRRIESRDRFQLRSLRQKGHAARLWTDFLIAAPRRRIARFPRPFRLFASTFFSRHSRLVPFFPSRVHRDFSLFVSAAAINPFTSYDIERSLFIKARIIFEVNTNAKLILFNQESENTFFFAHTN